ncbi:phosphatase PAP2 family protein [Streptomyces sp. MP131-18]|uniref:phosphatase PAP2 family protein n=1 Tax=Streptomyces sp. MP131-18 TaxID=1857892 RepID=UPI0009A16304|nr:phosphatase PAP2 family protein [Streptomyces sp. MP131-18]ONK12285.1 Polyprenol-phosphate-mannose-dependent alpha-(1-2)-phosphatidylinositol mannoside mannosyltransferase [Streptomyces sp. MP131-18]
MAETETGRGRGGTRSRYAVWGLWAAAGLLAARQAVEVWRLAPDERLTGLPSGSAPLHTGNGVPAPPAAGLLLEPLGGLPAEHRGILWLLLTLLTAAALVLVAARALPAAHRRWAAPAGFCLLVVSLPLRETATVAQAGLFAILLALAGWLLATRRAAGGAFIGLAAALQPPLLLFAGLLLLTGRRRAAGTAGGAFAAATALAWALRPAESVTFWLRHLAGAGLGEAPDAAANQSLHGALLRLGAAGPGEIAAFAVLATVVCGFALRRAARYAGDGQPLLAAAVVGCAALAATPVAGQEQQLWLLCAAAGRAGRRTADRPMWPVFVALALVLEGTALVPKLESLAVVGENIPLIAALLAACAVRFLARGSELWSRPVRAGLASRPNLLLELLLIRVGYWAYSWVRSYARGDRDTAEAHGHQILDIQRFLHIDIEHSLNRAVAARPWLSDAMDFYYQTFHFAVPLTILGWLLVRHPAEYRTARRWLALTTLFGLVGFWLYPLAPPRLMPGLGYIDTANGPQDLNDPRYGALTGITNPYAAMPSLHVGWSLWCALVLWRVAPYRWLRVAGLAYPLLTTVVIMGTANHYLLDAAGGAAVVGAGFAASAAIGRALARVPGGAQDRPERPPAAVQLAEAPTAAPSAAPSAVPAGSAPQDPRPAAEKTAQGPAAEQGGGP